jgi:hypothetical protein
MLTPTDIGGSMRTRDTIARVAGAAAVIALAVAIPVGVAAAADYPTGGTPPEVSPATEVQPTQVQPTEVAAKEAAKTTTLPFTGTDIVELTAIAGASAGIGFVMVRRSRRASTA